MTGIHVLCVGRLKEKFYADACAEYAKRLTPFCRLTVTELPEERLPPRPSPAQIRSALGREAAALRARLPPGAWTVALCVEGPARSSEEFAALLRTWESGPGKGLAFLIGSSHGLDEALKRQARVRLSLSPMTFPHHLSRVMLLEQLYRAFQINGGTKYHK